MGRIIKVKVKKGWKRTERFFHRNLKRDYMAILKRYADKGLEALKEATPKDTGKTADSWDYHIETGNGLTRLEYTNSNDENGVNVAILLIHGHATKNGGYVEGFDFVTPALRPVFQDLADAMFFEITEP